ncbi:MAG: hypothetical protein J2P13_01135 [Acidobacteria bacterium]|nr:hypothetical protein [Acidobacteriota bacterium]
MNLVSKCRRLLSPGAWCAVLLVVSTAAVSHAASTRVLGTVKSISGNSIVLSTDKGGDSAVTLTDSTRILKVLPGQTIKDATPIQASEIKIGDRVLAAVSAGGENQTIASTLVVMKQTDIAENHQQEREQWRRGVGGIVKEVNAPAGTISIGNALASGAKPILIHVSPSTSIRRYAPDSVNFDDAKTGTLDEIKPGDQVRARGTKNSDGTEFAAQAIISGTFRQIAGTVISADAAGGNLTVMDLAVKKPVILKVTSDSEMRKLPQSVAQRLATRLKGGSPSGDGGPSPVGAGSNGAASQTAQGDAGGRWNRGQGQAGAGARRAAGGSGPPPGGPAGFAPAGAAPDFQQVFSRMPSVSLADLQKGDAILVVATAGSPTSAPVTIALVSGVEPILTAAPNGAAAATILSPWNLGAPTGGEAAPE